MPALQTLLQLARPAAAAADAPSTLQASTDRAPTAGERSAFAMEATPTDATSHLRGSITRVRRRAIASGGVAPRPTGSDAFRAASTMGIHDAIDMDSGDGGDGGEWQQQ